MGKLNLDRSSYLSVYIASHNMSQRQTVIGQLLMLKKFIPSELKVFQNNSFFIMTKSS